MRVSPPAGSRPRRCRFRSVERSRRGRGGAARLILLVASLSLAACGAQDPQGAPAILFRDVHVVDAVSGPRADLSVLVEGDRIVAVGPASEVEAPAGARIVEGAGGTLIPGLWDAHVHFDYEPEVARAMLPLFIANGITAVRDTGGHVDRVLPWRGLSSSADVPAPRVFVAGPLVDGVPRVYDGGVPSRPDLAVEVADAEAASRAVDALADAGVDLIKAYEMLSPAAFEAVVGRAAARGLPTTGHLPLGVDLATAVDGLRSMEHLRNLEMACAADAEALLAERRDLLTNPEGLSGGDLRSAIHAAQRGRAVRDQDETRCAAVIETLRASGTWQVPTLTVSTPRVVRLHATEAWRDTFRYLPEPARSEWIEGALEMAQVDPDADTEAYVAWAFDMVGRLAAAGVPIMAGTDTPIFFLTPGFSLHEELALLVRSGLTPLQAIAAATIEPARYFGLEDRMGSIAPGRVADLVLLEASPLEEIGNTRRIRAVVSRGRFYDRQALDGMLEGLERGETIAPLVSQIPVAAPLSEAISMPPRPDWCDQLPRAAYAALEAVPSPDDWYEVYRVADGVHAIYEPAQWQEVISYLIVGSERALLWDSGMGIGDLRAVVDSLTDLPVLVVNSHSHFDHVGANADFDQVWSFGLEYTARNAAGADNVDVRAEVAPEALCRELPGGLEADDYAIRPYRVTRRIEDGEMIDLGGRRLEVIATPGHTPDAAMLLDPEAGLLFTGDSFYEGPIYLFAPETDLAAYRTSIERVAALADELTMLLPGHNTPVSDPQLLVRLREVLEAIDAGTLVPDLDGGGRLYSFDAFSILLAPPLQE